MRRTINSVEDRILREYFHIKRSQYLTSADEPVLLFKAILNFITKNKWKYLHDPSSISLDSILNFSEGSSLEVNCHDLSSIFQKLCQRVQISNVEIVEINFRAGKEIGTTFSASSPSIMPFDGDLTKFVDKQFIFTRHFVAYVNNQYYDLVFSTFCSDLNQLFDDTPYAILLNYIYAEREDAALHLLAEDKSIDLNKTFEGLTLLWRAAFGGLSRVIKALIERGCDPSVISAANGQLAIEAFKVDNVSDLESEAFLLLSTNVEAKKIAQVIEENSFTLAEKMMQPDVTTNLGTYIPKWIDINYQDVNGLTLLHLAVMNNNYYAIEWLINNNAKVIIKDNYGLTPLEYLKIYSILDISSPVFNLLSNGIDPSLIEGIRLREEYNNEQVNIAIQMIVEHNFNGVMDIIDSGLNVDYLDTQGQGLLHHAAICDEAAVVKFLIEKNIAIIENFNGQSPLDLCAPNSECYKLIAEYMQSLNISFDCIDAPLDTTNKL